jgi:hypothetical protein
MDMNNSVRDMSVSDLNGLLEVCTHRPDFKLRVHGGEADWWLYGTDPCIILSVFVVNTYHPDQPKIELTMHQRVPSFVETVEDFYDMCLGVCLWFDEHECREWFKIDGKPWRNPHARPEQMFDARRQFELVRNMRPAAAPEWMNQYRVGTFNTNTA